MDRAAVCGRCRQAISLPKVVCARCEAGKAPKFCGRCLLQDSLKSGCPLFCPNCRGRLEVSPFWLRRWPAAKDTRPPLWGAAAARLYYLSHFRCFAYLLACKLLVFQYRFFFGAVLAAAAFASFRGYRPAPLWGALSCLSAAASTSLFVAMRRWRAGDDGSPLPWDYLSWKGLAVDGLGSAVALAGLADMASFPPVLEDLLIIICVMCMGGLLAVRAIAALDVSETRDLLCLLVIWAHFAQARGRGRSANLEGRGAKANRELLSIRVTLFLAALIVRGVPPD